WGYGRDLICFVQELRKKPVLLAGIFHFKNRDQVGLHPIKHFAPAIRDVGYGFEIWVSSLFSDGQLYRVWVIFLPGTGSCDSLQSKFDAETMPWGWWN